MVMPLESLLSILEWTQPVHSNDTLASHKSIGKITVETGDIAKEYMR